jgi:hypothetical protein
MDKTLYKLQTEPAKKDIELDKEREMEVRMFPESEDDSETLAFLKKRFQRMEDARPDQDWATRWEQFEALLAWNDDGTANVNLPIEFATIRNKVADALSRKPVIELNPTEKDDVDKVNITKHIWDFVWTEADTDKENFTLTTMCYIFGTAFWFEGLHKEIKTQYLPKVNEDGTVKGIAKTTEKSWLKGFALDIRDVYVDPVHSIEVASDCFILERDVSRERLDNFRFDPNFKNIDQALKIGTIEDKNLKPFITEEEEARGNNIEKEKYTLYHYYNKEKGLYIVTVENIVVIREGVTPFAHGELPISVLVDHEIPRQIYGRGECQLLESTKYERNAIRNQIIDTARRSNDIRLAVGAKTAFNDIGYVDDTTQVIEFEGDMSQFQYLKQPPQDNSLFNVDNQLQNDATWQTGIDNNALVGSPNKTAFEARLQEQTKLKGISVSLKLADFFFTRMARQRLANIQFWLPATTGRQIVGNDKFRTIAIKNVKKKPITRLNKKSNKAEEVGIKLETKDNNTEFIQLKPSIIQSNIDIRVTTPSTTSILQELNKVDLQELFKNILEAAQVDPEVLKKFDIDNYLNERVKQIGFDPEDFLKSANSGDDISETRSSVLGDLPLPFKTSTQPQRSEVNPILEAPDVAQVATSEVNQ